MRPRHRLAPALVLVLAGTLVCSAPSAALAEPPGPPSDAEVQTRLAFLEARLEAGTAAADRWWYAWYAGYGALTLGQYTIALATKDPGLRADMAVGAVTSSLGIGPLGLLPFTPRLAAAKLRSLPEDTPEQRRRKLARAETLLHKSAEVETFGRGWLAHVAGDGVSIASGVILALVYHRVRTGILNSIAGVAITEFQIFTQPTAAIADWDAYTKGAFHGAPRARAPRLTLSLTASAGGMGVSAAF